MSRNVRVAGSLHEEGENVGLHRFALFTACSTAFLTFVGGLVTSNQAGLSVPDWPTSYGWNMFTFPYSKWVGGIFYEHGHRRVASFVGLLTMILASWTWLRESRLWLRVLSLIALFAVITQGILGGLTVKYLLPTPVSMTHACLAQTFFCMTIALAFFTSPTWKHGLPRVRDSHSGATLTTLCALTTGAVYIRLLLGAWMRHTQSGLAIPDFPLAFGKLIPEFTNYHIAIHFAHRVGAVLVVATILWTFTRLFREHRQDSLLFRPAIVMLVLVCAQLTFGAFAIWTEKAPIITTVHVATGALILGTSFLLTLRAFGSVARETEWQ
jgi:cytochrome c oxidase assembly protein subunit 15